ncbi:nucleotidyltransferase family protein [Cohnella pontilimi]|nr:nucleotidyltransferase family protein [Cohnella pontilimi]
MKTVAIYLAAGMSSRMGRDKLSLPTKAGPVGGLAFAEVIRSKVEHILVITRTETVPGWMPERFTKQPEAARWTQITCRHAWKGQAHSISEGILQAELRGAEAVLILLADQPLVSEKMINAALEIFEDPAEPATDIVITSYNGIYAPPVVFSEKLFSDLLKLKGDEGAKSIIHRHERKRILTADPRNLLDIDNEEDYRRLLEITGG